ncbi:hypothetical protein BKN38_03375 [Helicobacter sp. CLO-3]|nr:hypothetical protein BA723_01970 [Helicobacter sp. CLO-3]OHU84191.1 hypothetical protein BKN38_03375 [Helicobacter sp. CLO-3]
MIFALFWRKIASPFGFCHLNMHHAHKQFLQFLSLIFFSTLIFGVVSRQSRYLQFLDSAYLLAFDA